MFSNNVSQKLVRVANFSSGLNNRIRGMFIRITVAANCIVAKSYSWKAEKWNCRKSIADSPYRRKGYNRKLKIVWLYLQLTIPLLVRTGFQCIEKTWFIVKTKVKNVSKGAIETRQSGYPSARYSYQVINIKGVGQICLQTLKDTYCNSCHCQIVQLKYSTCGCRFA